MDEGIKKIFEEIHSVDFSKLVDYTPYLLNQKQNPNTKLLDLFIKGLLNYSEKSLYLISNANLIKKKYPQLKEYDLLKAITTTAYNSEGNILVCSYSILITTDSNLNKKKHVKILEGAINEDLFKNPQIYIPRINKEEKTIDLIVMN